MTTTIALPAERQGMRFGSPGWRPGELESPSQSLEGEEVRRVALAIVNRWLEMAQEVLVQSPSPSDLPYDPVPLETAFVVRPRFRDAGRMEPLPYELPE